MGYYDVFTLEKGIIPLVLAMSKEDAMHLIEIKGYTPLDADLSLNDINVYK